MRLGHITSSTRTGALQGCVAELQIHFYTTIIQSVFCTSFTVWFVLATKQDRSRLQRTVRTTGKITGANFPSIQDLYMSRVRKQAGNITADPSHPGYNLFQLLPSGRRYRALYAKTSRQRNTFSPHTVTLMNRKHLTHSGRNNHCAITCDYDIYICTTCKSKHVLMYTTSAQTYFFQHPLHSAKLHYGLALYKCCCFCLWCVCVCVFYTLLPVSV